MDLKRSMGRRQEGKATGGLWGQQLFWPYAWFATHKGELPYSIWLLHIAVILIRYSSPSSVMKVHAVNQVREWQKGGILVLLSNFFYSNSLNTNIGQAMSLPLADVTRPNIYLT